MIAFNNHLDVETTSTDDNSDYDRQVNLSVTIILPIVHAWGNRARHAIIAKLITAGFSAC